MTDQEISIKDYLEVLAARIASDNRNVTEEAVKKAFKEFRDDEMEPLKKRIFRLEKNRWMRDGALGASLLAHVPTLAKLFLK